MKYLKCQKKNYLGSEFPSARKTRPLLGLHNMLSKPVSTQPQII